MEDDRRLIVPGAKSIPIRIVGAWDAYMWTGVVSADEELAGVILVRAKDGISWSRSRRAAPSGLALTFSVGSDPSVSETWFSVDLGGGMRWGRFAGHLNFDFAHSNPDAPHTGQVKWLSICSGTESTLQVGILALARSDVRFGRKRIWRLKPELHEALSDELRLMLVDRRFGTLPGTG